MDSFKAAEGGHAYAHEDRERFKARRRPDLAGRPLAQQVASHARLIAAVALSIVALTVLARSTTFTSRPAIFPDHLERQIRENCMDVEFLKESDECIVDIARERQLPHSARHASKRRSNEDDGDLELDSPYGLVLHYNSQYNASAAASQRLRQQQRQQQQYRLSHERYHQTVSMRCLIGFSTSISWALDFEDSLVAPFDFGVYSSFDGLDPDHDHDHDHHAGPALRSSSSSMSRSASSGMRRGSQAAVSASLPVESKTCPRLSVDSAASLDLYINCGFDIDRDAAGQPATAEDLEAVETCVKLAYSWMKGRGSSLEAVEPWHSLCSESAEGAVEADRELHCRTDVFDILKLSA